jgi:hypothetical protein
MGVRFQLKAKKVSSPYAGWCYSYVFCIVTGFACWGIASQGSGRFLFAAFFVKIFYVQEPIMSINVKLTESLVEQARRYAVIQHRSVPKQIEYWSQIGKIAEENPDLPFSMIRDILLADQEEPVGEYVFS